jgi:C4-dicarboxylate-specific signal transduction histidine kinase
MRARSEAQAIAVLLAILFGVGFLYLRLRERRKKDQLRSAAERDQREKERQLQRTARLASVGEMASTIAHDLNQPLMALSNFAIATKAMLHSAPPALLDAALNDIVQQAKRASEIVKRVRAFINPQKSSYEYFDINGLISHAIEMMQAELQRTPVSIHLSLAPGLVQVCGDKILLEQVIVNLIQNAIHAQLDKPESDRLIKITTQYRLNSLKLSIADCGHGIPSEKIDEIFMPFFTTKTDGLGLGLNICRTIIEAHGGSISVENGPTFGAVFTITLPIIE